MLVFQGWASYAGVEFLNASRTVKYARTLMNGVQISDCAGCEDLAQALGDKDYTTPFVDQPEWFDPANPDTWGFAGFYPLSVEGVEDSTRTAAVTQLATDGAYASTPRAEGREIRFSGLLLGVDDAAVQAGMTWLRHVLEGDYCRSSGGCTGDHLCYFAACPQICEDSPVFDTGGELLAENLGPNPRGRGNPGTGWAGGGVVSWAPKAYAQPGQTVQAERGFVPDSPDGVGFQYAIASADATGNVVAINAHRRMDITDVEPGVAYGARMQVFAPQQPAESLRLQLRGAWRNSAGGRIPGVADFVIEEINPEAGGWYLLSGMTPPAPEGAARLSVFPWWTGYNAGPRTVNLCPNPRYVGQDGKQGGGSAAWDQEDVTAADVVDGENLVHNPRYIGTDGKQGGGSAQWSQEDVETGGPDGGGWTRITATADATGGVVVGNDESAFGEVTPGQTYTASTHILPPAGGDIPFVRVQIRWRDADGNQISGTTGPSTQYPGDGWGRYSVTGVAPEGAVNGQVLANLGYVSGEAGNIVTGDEFGVAMRMLTVGTELVDYYDGYSLPRDGIRFRWAGDPNNSVSQMVHQVFGPDGGGFTLVTATADQTGVVDIGTDAGARTPVTAGETYTALTHMLAVQPMYQFHVYLAWMDDNGQGVGNDGEDTTPGPQVGVWQEMQISATAPPGATQVQVRARLSYNADQPMRAGEQYAVGCRIIKVGEEVLTTEDYFDGDYPDDGDVQFGWEGPEHASASWRQAIHAQVLQGQPIAWAARSIMAGEVPSAYWDGDSGDAGPVSFEWEDPDEAPYSVSRMVSSTAGELPPTYLCPSGEELPAIESCVAPYERHMYSVTTIEGPLVTQEYDLDCGAMWEVEFTMMAGVPDAYGAPQWVGCVEEDFPGGIVIDDVDCEPDAGFPPVQDPRCVVPLPPRPPLILDDCLAEPDTWRRYQFDIDEGFIPAWSDAVPTIRLRTRVSNANQVRLRFYPNPFGRDVTNINGGCDFCGEFMISHIPKNSLMVIDGVQRQAWIETYDGETAKTHGASRLSATHLLYGSDGGPMSWPLLSCGAPYAMTVDVVPDTINQLGVCLCLNIRE